jgi:phenylpropionate dioxygenase-like ring-hydroxylating dioxygenase large terminal subunit
MEGNKEAQKEARINTGLRNYWYPVAASWNVKNAPVGITRLSQNIVLWRDTAGQVHALEDRCPHRGARLSMGWNLGDHVACWYHGVEVNGQGTVTSVPAVDACPMEGKTCVRSYPVQERAGAIFLWFGDKAPSEFDDAVRTLRLPEELTSDEHSHFLCFAHWNVNYRYAIDNVMDPMHGAYLHAVSHSMASGEKKAVMEVVETDHGIMFQKTGQRGVNFDWTEFGETGTMWLRLSIPYQPKVGPGGPFTIIGIVTPVDEEHCIVYFWRTRHVQGWQRDVWRFLYRNRLEGLHWDVLEQDRVVLESMAPEARDHETLYQHDIGITRIRRVLARRAAAELADAPVAMLKPVPTEAQHA